MFRRNSIETTVVEQPEAITDEFREKLHRTALRNDNEIAELEAQIADAQARLMHRQSVARALQAAMVELGITNALNMMARDIASLPLTEYGRRDDKNPSAWQETPNAGVLGRA